MLKVAIREYCFANDRFFSEPDELQEPETDSALHQKVSLVLDDFAAAVAVRKVGPAQLTTWTAKQTLKTL